MEDAKTWIFPETIQFEEVSDYLKKFQSHNSSHEIIFDLRKTRNIHSSFIGFLIHAKDQTRRKNTSLSILTSFSMDRILSMMNVLDYLSPEIVSRQDRNIA
jgi:anti-anti-sigma regulatory factor